MATTLRIPQDASFETLAAYIHNHVLTAGLRNKVRDARKRLRTAPDAFTALRTFALDELGVTTIPDRVEHANVKRFREVYTAKLQASVTRNPDDYMYGPDDVGYVVELMLCSMLCGTAVNISPALKAARTTLGIRTQPALYAFLGVRV